MRERLELAVWPKPAEYELALAQIEVEVLAQLLPPLNLTGGENAMDGSGQGRSRRDGRRR